MSFKSVPRRLNSWRMFWPSRDFTTQKNLGMAHKLCQRQASIQQKGARVVSVFKLVGRVGVWNVMVVSVVNGSWCKTS